MRVVCLLLHSEFSGITTAGSRGHGKRKPVEHLLNSRLALHRGEQALHQLIRSRLRWGRLWEHGPPPFSLRRKSGGRPSGARAARGMKAATQMLSKAQVREDIKPQVFSKNVRSTFGRCSKFGKLGAPNDVLNSKKKRRRTRRRKRRAMNATTRRTRSTTEAGGGQTTRRAT